MKIFYRVVIGLALTERLKQPLADGVLVVICIFPRRTCCGGDFCIPLQA